LAVLLILLEIQNRNADKRHVEGTIYAGLPKIAAEFGTRVNKIQQAMLNLRRIGILATLRPGIGVTKGIWRVRLVTPETGVTQDGGVTPESGVSSHPGKRAGVTPETGVESPRKAGSESPRNRGTLIKTSGIKTSSIQTSSKKPRAAATPPEPAAAAGVVFSEIQKKAFEAMGKCRIGKSMRATLISEIPELTEDAVYELSAEIDLDPNVENPAGMLVTRIRDEAQDIIARHAAEATQRAEQEKAEQEKKLAEQQRVEKERKALERKWGKALEDAKRKIKRKNFRRQYEALNGQVEALAAEWFKANFAGYEIPKGVDRRVLGVWALDQQDINRAFAEKEAQFQRDKAAFEEKQRVELERQKEEQRLEYERRQQAEANRKAEADRLEAEQKAREQAERDAKAAELVAFKGSFTPDEWSRQVAAFFAKWTGQKLIYSTLTPELEQMLVSEIRGVIDNGALPRVTSEKPE